jgi:serine phosphatase RsbU (regulator of sigma subunit)
METRAGKLPILEWGMASRPMPGETASGDDYVVQPLPDGVLLAVVDGVGHGPDASAAAREAIAILQAHAHEPLIPLFELCHGGLRRTDGVVLSLAAFDVRDSTLTWLGVGNVECLLIRADVLARPARDSVLQRGGVVGYRLPPLRSAVLSVAPGDLLIFATDGIRSRFADSLDLDRAPQQIADDVLTRHARESDDALVLVARFHATAP